MICGIIFLHPEEIWITMIGTELQKIELIYDKRQNATTLNRGSN